MGNATLDFFISSISSIGSSLICSALNKVRKIFVPPQIS